MALISFSRKFVFIKTRKVAGTSIEALLRPYLSSEDIIPAVTPRDEFYSASAGAHSRNYLKNVGDEKKYTDLVLNEEFAAASEFLASCRKIASSHMTYKKIAEIVRKNGACIQDFFIFTVERHPYDWLLSNLLYDNASYNRSGRGLASQNLPDIEDVARRYLSRHDIKKKMNWWLYTQNGRVMAHRILKYEQLAEDLESVLQRLVPECSVSEMPFLKENRAGADARELFSDDLKSLVREIFSPVFGVMGYET